MSNIKTLIKTVPCSWCDAKRGEYCIYYVNNKGIPYTIDVHSQRLADYTKHVFRFNSYRLNQEHNWRRL